MFFELRQYRVKPQKRQEWVDLMENKIIPFQISKGMVVIGSFVGQEEEDLYVWIRRFESEEQRQALYASVYESDYWKNDIAPLVGDMLDRERIQVTRLVATPKSVIQ
ncbi:MAG: NIPSNAP family protein [Anaerolineae bacterium]|nr:NIPSNAP family protein [Anaerolineae bacterium]